MSVVRLTDEQRETLEKYLYLARAVAKRYTNNAVENDDIFQAAAEGLMKGIQTFDPQKGDLASHLYRRARVNAHIYWRRNRSVVSIPNYLYERKEKCKETLNLIECGTRRICVDHPFYTVVADHAMSRPMRASLVLNNTYMTYNPDVENCIWRSQFLETFRSVVKSYAKGRFVAMAEELLECGSYKIVSDRHGVQKQTLHWAMKRCIERTQRKMGVTP